MPKPVFPLMRLPTAVVPPPIVLPEAPLPMVIPLPPLAMAAVPTALVPMKLPATR
jgi:hypothetical protein